MNFKILPLALSLLLFISLANVAKSQCQTFVFPGTGALYPDTNSNLPSGAVTQPYNTVIQINVPPTWIVNGFPVPIDSIHILSLTGLPVGFIYATNKLSSTWKKNERGCVEIKGTPTISNIGTYTINFNLEAAVLGNIMPVNNVGNYKLKIWDATHVSIDNIDETKDQILNVYPNPMSSSSTIDFYSNAAKSVDVEVVNILGSVVYSSSKAMIAGKNTIKIEKGNLPAGMYWIKISTDTSKLTQKLIIE